LPDEVFRDLEKVAGERGLTPADWIATALPVGSGAMKQQPPYDMLQGLIGAVDSTKGGQSGKARSIYGELIARKFERQGFRKQGARSPSRGRDKRVE
jgi:hypothetical protein